MHWLKHRLGRSSLSPEKAYLHSCRSMFWSMLRWTKIHISHHSCISSCYLHHKREKRKSFSWYANIVCFPLRINHCQMIADGFWNDIKHGNGQKLQSSIIKEKKFNIFIETVTESSHKVWWKKRGIYLFRAAYLEHIWRTNLSPIFSYVFDSWVKYLSP